MVPQSLKPRMNEKHPISMPDAAQHPALRPYPSKLFVEVTTRCNLRCSMCLKEARGQRIAEGDISRETLARLAPAFQRLDALILNGIGEPLLHPFLETFIEDARRAMPASGWVGFQTNGQLLSRERARSLAGAGIDRICISADAVSSDLFMALRRGGRLGLIESAAAALHQAGRERGRPISLGVEFVVMRDNLHQLPEIVRWAARNHFTFVVVTHMLAYDEQMAGAAAFDVMTDRSLQLHREWRERTAADGVDVRRCFQAFMKLHYARRTPAEQRLVEYVLRMNAQASEQGVFLDIDRLLGWDDAPLQQVKGSFAQAEDIARREGIDLRLPAAVPTRARRCDFVEDGGSFVSWDGDVHPCYFLWHRYSSHTGGVVKHVKPLSFGNLAERDVLDIWNDAAARAFRENVLRYDYPFCYDCNVALCDYVQGEDFTQDCHMSAVPCGACLWSTGVFQCLR
jgi:putative metalloenzyme radical SAM/SPASM domain maturase